MSDDPEILQRTGGRHVLGTLTEDTLNGISRLLVGRDSGQLRGEEWRSEESDGRYQAVIRWDGSRYEAWSALLQDNVDGSSPSVVTPDAATVVRVLAYDLSAAWRRRHGLASILLPIGKGRLQPGFVVNPLSPTTVRWSDGDHRLSATLEHRHVLVAFSYFARCSVGDLVTSITSEDGSPLFAAWYRDEDDPR